MNRNVESHFATNPTSIDISRSRFDRSFSVKTSFNAGDVIPFYLDEVLPGDTFNVKTSRVVRMQPLVAPIMDNVYLDTYYFFVPNRLVWEHWQEFNGENTQSAWVPTVEYSVPQITAPEGGWNVGTLADYFGLPTGVSNISVSALPFRAYALIMNDWFRDENLIQPLNISFGDATVQGVNTGTYVTDVAKGGLPFRAAKYHDYFTSALPSPQKGPDVTVSLLGSAPVVPYEASNAFEDFQIKNGNVVPASYTTVSKFLTGGYDNTNANSEQVYTFSGDTNVHHSSPFAVSNDSNLLPTNLRANLSDLNVVTINQLRTAFQVQKLYERDAIGGSRYIELLKSHFGVTSPDARLQRPEYLGGNRVPININQVVQNSQTTEQSPQGNPVGLSLTTDSHSDFTKSFVEHGFIIGVMVARYDHTYQQGIERMWSRKGRFDYYWPVFANLGEMAILNKEIYAQGTAKDNEVFGYQEAWADYRYKPNRVTGEMRSQYAQSLDIWHLADDYSSLPSLSPEWIMEDKSPIDRVLAVSSQNANQFFADIYVQNYATRPMPLYSIPGLIDHH